MEQTEQDSIPFGPAGMNLRPQPAPVKRLARRAGLIAILIGGVLTGLIIYGIFTRGAGASDWGKRADRETRVTGARDAGKQFTHPVGTAPERIKQDELDPPPFRFLPRTRESVPPVQPAPPPASIPQRAQSAATAPPPLVHRWEPPNSPAWAVPEPAQPMSIARTIDREREAMEAATAIGRGSLGARPMGLPEAASSGPKIIPASGGNIGGAPFDSRDPEDAEASSQVRKDEFLRTARKGGSGTRVSSTRARQITPYEIKAGWDIPAILEQEINSDLPGEIRALVRESVFDTASGSHLLIPQGSRLIGSYDAHVAYAQSALLVVWHRIIFPDGSSIDLEGMNSQDARGQSGLRGSVNHHYGRIFGTAILSTAFSAAAIVAQSRRQTILTVPSAQDVAAGAAASEVARLGSAITRKNLNIQPTIRIAIGTRFSVRVHRDLLFEAPYRPFENSRLSDSE